MGISEADLLQWMTQYAYQAWLIYLGIFLLMMASGFGLPIPEEMTLISSGLVCYVASRPDMYPPPFPGATAVNPYVTAGVALFSVIFADCLVFTLGKLYGGKILRSSFMARYRPRFEKVEEWTKKYGMWAAGGFRFTPGLRFPGHFACGMMGLSVSKFLFVDATAALLSVPTQVLLVAHYGDKILWYFDQFKLVLFSLLGLGLIYYFARWIWKQKKRAGE